MDVRTQNWNQIESRTCDSTLNKIGKSILMLFMRKFTHVNKQHKICLFLSFTIFHIHFKVEIILSLFTLFYSFPGSPSCFLYSYSWINMQIKKYFKAFRVIYTHLLNLFLLLHLKYPAFLTSDETEGRVMLFQDIKHSKLQTHATVARSESSAREREREKTE